ncbi:proline racemase family protein, partial [Gammaproteobacteria bacterium]|nr:proline racemase family protein [Gammaproteobacteria bacterium]
MKVSFECVDGHTAGMPVRMVVSGAPDLQGADQSERRQHFIHEFDWIRRALMFEPRGHSAMSGSIIYPPSSDDFDMGVIYIETTGSLPMCGHGTIGTATFALERGLVTPKVEGLLRLETPAGRVDVQYVRDGDKVTTAKLINVPSF